MFLCYVILHYMDADTTIECVDSILKTSLTKDYKIIVVDNASNNGSYERLVEYYLGNSNIICIKNEKNLGFSGGNNVGYRYAKEHFCPEYILIGNNDLVFHQNDFAEKLAELGEKYPFYVAGPDIINLKGIHQSPIRANLHSYKTMKKKTRNRKILLTVMKIKKALPFLQGFNLFEKMYYGKGESIQKKNDNVGISKNVILHGACVIFSKAYIEKHEDAFPEYTFLYMEEDILALRCQKLGYDTYYLPELMVEHKEDVSTDTYLNNKLDKNIFVFTQTIKSGKTYMKLLEKDVI